jgi:hypothetical protein
MGNTTSPDAIPQRPPTWTPLEDLALEPPVPDSPSPADAEWARSAGLGSLSKEIHRIVFRGLAMQDAAVLSRVCKHLHRLYSSESLVKLAASNDHPNRALSTFFAKAVASRSTPCFLQRARPPEWSSLVMPDYLSLFVLVDRVLSELPIADVRTLIIRQDSSRMAKEDDASVANFLWELVGGNVGNIEFLMLDNVHLITDYDDRFPEFRLNTMHFRFLSCGPRQGYAPRLGKFSADTICVTLDGLEDHLFVPKTTRLLVYHGPETADRALQKATALVSASCYSTPDFGDTTSPKILEHV